MKRSSVFKRTTDDWYPSYTLHGREGSLVEISFIQLQGAPEERNWRVCCWGGDDMGLERDYPSESEAWSVFVQVIGWEYVNQNQLVCEFGFYSA